MRFLVVEFAQCAQGRASDTFSGRCAMPGTQIGWRCLTLAERLAFRGVGLVARGKEEPRFQPPPPFPS
eukprot:2363418-Rhodomonas_salina.1